MENMFQLFKEVQTVQDEPYCPNLQIITVRKYMRSYPRVITLNRSYEGTFLQIQAFLTTMVQKNQESGHWATRLYICFFTCTTHAFACSALLALLAHSVAHFFTSKFMQK